MGLKDELHAKGVRCFGEVWNSSEPQCAGGLNPTTGTRHDRCGWFDLCLAHMTRPPPQQQFVQLRPQQPTNIPVTTPTYPWQPPRVAPMVTPQQPMMQRPTQSFAQPGMYPTHAPPATAIMPYEVPMNAPWPGAYVPSFLSIPEQSTGSVAWKTLWSTVFRSVVKASGMAAANYFDYTPWYPWVPK